LWGWFKLIAAVELPLIGVNDEKKSAVNHILIQNDFCDLKLEETTVGKVSLSIAA
jgi:hypothetical protein